MLWWLEAVHCKAYNCQLISGTSKVCGEVALPRLPQPVAATVRLACSIWCQ
jgi:hypothetical protein